MVSISPSQIQTRNLITSEVRNILPTGQFFRDDSGMLTEGRKSTRLRKKTAFYTYDKPGGEIEKNISQPHDDGFDLIGQKFWNADSSDEMPKCYIVLGARRHGGRSHRVLDYALEDDQDGKKFFSKVSVVRKWMQDDLPETPGQSSVHLTESFNEDILEPPSNSLFEDKGIGNLRAAPTFKIRNDVAKCLRSKIKTHRRFNRPKKIPRRVIISVLRGKIKKSFFKYGVSVPDGYKDATRKDNIDRDDWIAEMTAEINGLSELNSFNKGFSRDTLPEGVSIEDVIRSIWVYDVKVDSRKRARLALEETWKEMLQTKSDTLL